MRKCDRGIWSAGGGWRHPACPRWCCHLAVFSPFLATFVAYDHHSLLWTEATAFERSQRSYLQPLTSKVCCSTWPQQLKCYKVGCLMLYIQLKNMCIKHVHITCASFEFCQKISYYPIILTTNTKYGMILL